MDLPAQPPPDTPAPPPGPEALWSRQKMRWIIGAGILSILGLALALPYSRWKRTRITGCDVTETTNNARQLHLALFNFDSDYGRFPDASTVAAVKADTGTTVTLGTSSSNELLRQLLVTVCKAESVFWGPSELTPRKPDNDMSGSRALEKGECSFAYVAGLSTSSDAETPVLIAPVAPGKRGFERREENDDMAVVLFIDGSAKKLPIDKHGNAMLNGMDLLNPRQPFWGGKAPDVKWPE